MRDAMRQKLLDLGYTAEEIDLTRAAYDGDPCGGAIDVPESRERHAGVVDVTAQVSAHERLIAAFERRAAAFHSDAHRDPASARSTSRHLTRAPFCRTCRARRRGLSRLARPTRPTSRRQP